LIGGSLLHLTLGSIFCYGNLSPYIASYLTYATMTASSQSRDEFDIAGTYQNFIDLANWVLFIIITCMSLFIIFGGNVEVKIGPTRTLIIASFLVTIGFGATYFSLLANSMWLIVITYGIIFGSGVGIGYPVLVIVCMRWFPKQRGLICGIISAVFGSGAFVFDSIQTKLVNPHNLAIDASYGYVLQMDVVSRIPFMFAYVAAIMFTMQLIGIMCVRSPPWFISDSEHAASADIHGGGGDLKKEKSKTQLKYESYSMTLRQAASFWVFWELWINNFLYCIVLMFITAEWKIFATNYLNVNDDQLLSIVGSVSSLFNGFGRFFWGIFYDKNQSFPISMGLQCAICTVFIATMPFIKYVGDQSAVNVMFAIWLFFIWSCIGCEYAFLPSCIVETFGAKYCGSIVGVFVGGEAPATAIVVILSKYVFGNSDSDWMWYCVSMAICTLVSTVLSMLYKKGRVDRKRYIKLLQKEKKKSLKSIHVMQKNYNTMNTTTQH